MQLRPMRVKRVELTMSITCDFFFGCQGPPNQIFPWWTLLPKIQRPQFHVKNTYLYSEKVHLKTFILIININFIILYTLAFKSLRLLRFFKEVS